MSEYPQFKELLPPSELGDNRCIRMGYSYHGDVSLVTWRGDISYSPRVEDDISEFFSFAHGADVLLLASCIGYLRRAQYPEEQMIAHLTERTQEVQEDGMWDLSRYSIGASTTLEEILEDSESLSWDDINHMRCLMPPRPTSPGNRQDRPATGLYTKLDDNSLLQLIIACIEPRSLAIRNQSTFCISDIPSLIGMICSMSEGTSRMDLKILLKEYFGLT